MSTAKRTLEARSRVALRARGFELTVHVDPPADSAFTIWALDGSGVALGGAKHADGISLDELVVVAGLLIAGLTMASAIEVVRPDV